MSKVSKKSQASTADTHYVYEYVERLPTPPHYLDARSYTMKRGCNCTDFTEDHYRKLPTPYKLPPYVSFIERLSQRSASKPRKQD